MTDEGSHMLKRENILAELRGDESAIPSGWTTMGGGIVALRGGHTLVACASRAVRTTITGLNAQAILAHTVRMPSNTVWLSGYYRVHSSAVTLTILSAIDEDAHSAGVEITAAGAVTVSGQATTGTVRPGKPFLLEMQVENRGTDGLWATGFLATGSGVPQAIGSVKAADEGAAVSLVWAGVFGSPGAATATVDLAAVCVSTARRGRLHLLRGRRNLTIGNSTLAWPHHGSRRGVRMGLVL